MMNKLSLIIIFLLMIIVPSNAYLTTLNLGFEAGDNNWSFVGDYAYNSEGWYQMGYPILNPVNFQSNEISDAKLTGNFGLEQISNGTTEESAELMYDFDPAVASNITKIEAWYKIVDNVHIPPNYNELYIQIDNPYEVILDLGEFNYTQDWTYFSWDNSLNTTIDTIHLALWTDDGDELKIYWDNITVTYDNGLELDTTPPASITNLANTTTCQNTTLSWDNPLDEDFNTTIWRQDDVIVYYADNATTSHLFEGLSELTEYAFSGQTCDLTGNCNETAFGNMSVLTGACPVAPIVSFTTNTTSGTVPLAVGFTDTSTNTPTDWDWYINNVKFSDLQNPEYTFAEAGVYDVSLYAANGASGDWENKTGYITVTNWYDLQCENQTGNITINLFSNSTSSLGWNWDDPVNITKIAEDGLYVLSFDNSSDYFIGMGYSPESWHKLKIYNETDFGQLNCTTDAVPIIPTPIPIMPSTESNVNPVNLFQYWPYAVLVLGLVVVFKKW